MASEEDKAAAAAEEETELQSEDNAAPETAAADAVPVVKAVPVAQAKEAEGEVPVVMSEEAKRQAAAAKIGARQRLQQQQQQQQQQQSGLSKLDCCLIVTVIFLLLSFVGFVAYHLDAPLPWSWIGLGPPEHELTKFTWDEKTEGRDVFVKFYAPWCGHCKSMKGDWEQLRAEYANSSDVRIFDVDCAGQGRSLCKEVGVKSFPTLKYGDPSDLKGLNDYKGTRGYKTLSEFAATAFGPKCGPANMDLCSEEEKAKIRGLLALGEAKIKELVDEKVSEVQAVESAFDKLRDSLSEEYQKGQEEKDAKTAKITEPLNLLRMVVKMDKEEVPAAASQPSEEL